MRIASLSLILLALTLCACPRQDAPADSTQQPDATAAGDTTGEATASVPDGGIVVFHDPVLGEPLKSFARQVFVVLAEELALSPAGLESIRTAHEADDERRPQIVIFGYAPALPELAADGVIVESTARTFAGDRLVLAEKKDAGFSTRTLFDTYKLEFSKLGYLDDTTALGRPSRQALVSDGLLERIEERTEQFGSINELFGALLEDRVELAVLPASLVSQSNAISPVLVIGEDLHEDIRYIAAATPGNEDDPLVQQVLKLLAEDAELQQLLVGYGLLGREAALIEN